MLTTHAHTTTQTYTLSLHDALPISGSNRILKAMHRPYTAERYAQLVGKIRGARPGIAVTTDIIVGFPGETDSDYKATRDLRSEERRVGKSVEPGRCTTHKKKSKR